MILWKKQLEPPDADAKPEVKIRQGRNSKKPTKRHLSLRRFQKALGAAPSLESSGDRKKSKVVGGSDLCRKSLWQWVYTRIEPKKSRLKNDMPYSDSNLLSGWLSYVRIAYRDSLNNESHLGSK